MSSSFNIFLKCDEPLDVILSSLESILGCTLQHTSNHAEYHSAIVMGIGISLVYPFTYSDYDDLKFSEYDFEIMVEYKGRFDKNFADDFQQSASLVLADMLSRQLPCECLVLENMVHVLLRTSPNSPTIVS